MQTGIYTTKKDLTIVSAINKRNTAASIGIIADCIIVNTNQ